MKIPTAIRALLTPRRLVALSVLSVYSIVLMTLEIVISQPFVRPYFSDIPDYPVQTRFTPFFAINTTISVGLFFATALIFGVCLATAKWSETAKHERAFFWSQVVIFAWLGLDDRLKVHEWIGTVLHFQDALLIGAIGAIEVVLLWRWGRLRERTPAAQGAIVVAALFAIGMTLVDGWFPAWVPPRLSLEDLSKTWSTIFLLFFALEIHEGQVAEIARVTRKGHGGASVAPRANPSDRRRVTG